MIQAMLILIIRAVTTINLSCELQWSNNQASSSPLGSEFWRYLPGTDAPA